MNDGGNVDEPVGRDVLPAAVLRLTGEVDIGQAGLVRRQLRSHIRAIKDPVVVVDLSGVTFIDCAGLEPLLNANRGLLRRNRHLVLRSVSAQVEFLFTGLRRAGLMPPFEQSGGCEVAQVDLADDMDLADEMDVADDMDLAHLMDQAHTVETARLHRAFEDQPLIDQVTGLLMAVHDCAATEARVLLMRVSRQHKMTAGDLAAGLAGLAAARGGRSTLDLSPAMKAAVRGVLAYPGQAPAANSGPAPSSMS
jgi:anti-anti-sigma factor